MDKRLYKRLYVTDLDGTLLNAESRVGSRSARIITSLSSHGSLITVATARTPATVQPLLAHTSLSLPAIVMTGAAEWDTHSRTFTHVDYMNPQLADRVDAFVRSHGITPMRYVIGIDGIIHTYFIGSEPTPSERKFLDERSNLPLKRVHVNDCTLPPEASLRTVMFFAMGQLPLIMALGDELRRQGTVSVSAYGDIFNPHTGFLEIFAPGVSKASAIKRMAQRLGVEHITVFGDNLNDLPMMEIATCAVAVENANTAVKQAADVVIGPNTSDAVARYILVAESSLSSSSLRKNTLKHR